MLVKMPHSNFKERSREFNTGVGKCPCGQTFEYTSERDMKMKLRMYRRFCSNPPKGFDKIGIPKKATTLREQQLKGQLQRFYKLISNDRVWPSEHGFEVIFEKSLFIFEISPSKSGTSAGSILGFTRFPKIIIGKPSYVTSQVIKAP